jgi:hypothetical protein
MWRRVVEGVFLGGSRGKGEFRINLQICIILAILLAIG